MMEQAIRDFPQQFAYEPHIENEGALKHLDKFVIAGMGGSAFIGEVLKTYDPSLDIFIHRNYDLPEVPDKELSSRLIILSSYSGNTEEPLSTFYAAQKKNLSMIVITIGGKLLELAKKHSIPYIQLPDTHIQPRMATALMIKALAKAMKNQKLLHEMSALAETLPTQGLEENGKLLAQALKGSVPVIYASARNLAIALVWKIKCNETGKIPAFYNVLPELNHNEMTGFDVMPATASLSEKFFFLLMKDPADHPRIQKRMDILETLYQQRNLRVKQLVLNGSSKLEQIFSSLLLADWTAVSLAKLYNVESEEVPMVEEFKKLIEQ